MGTVGKQLQRSTHPFLVGFTGRYILRRLAVCYLLETVSPVCMALRISRLKRWLSSALDSRAWPLTWSPTTLVLSLVMTSLSRREILSRELEPLWMSPLATRSLDESLMPWVTPLMARVLLAARRGTELDLRHPVSFPGSLSRSPCRPVSKPSTVWCPSVVASVS